jgi:hypothetical protein
MTTSSYGQDQGRGGNRAVTRVNAGRLWAGGVATLVVVALVVVVGISLCRGILAIPVPVPTFTGGMSDVTYVLLACGAVLVATALVHLLIAAAPRPLVFFGWIVFLATVIAVLAPFSNSILGSGGHVALLSSKVATATINLVAGIAIGSLLSGVARSAITRLRPDPYPVYPAGGL